MPAVIVAGKRLRAVLDHQDSVFFRQLDHRAHRRARAKKVRDHNGPRAFRDGLFDRRYFRSQCLAFDVQRNRNESVMLRDINHLFDGQRGHQNLTASR